jgi:hypothetical protein
MNRGSNKNNYSKSEMYMMNRDEKYYEIESDYFQNTKKMEPPADYGENLQVLIYLFSSFRLFISLNIHYKGE